MNIKLIFILAISGLGSVLLNGCSSSDDAPIDSKSGKALTLDASFLRAEPMNIETRSVRFDTDTIFAGVMHSKEVNVSMSELSRAPLDDTPTWVGGEAITLKATSPSGTSYHEYAIGSSGSSSTLTSADPYYFTTVNNVTAAVWYPSTNKANKTTHAVLANQSTDANFKNSDFLYGSTTVAHNGLSNSISMAHKIAKVRVTVNVNNPVNLNKTNIVSVTLKGTKLTSSVGDGGALTANGSASNITMHPKGNGEYEACIIPQTASLSFAVNVGGTTYNSTAVASRAYGANNIYTATININTSKFLYQGNTSVDIGDFYGIYANGQGVLIDNTSAAVSAAVAKGITPVGIVYSKTMSTIDNGHGWTTGYCFALKDVGNSAGYKWSTITNANVMSTRYPWKSAVDNTYFTANTAWDGYTQTHRVTDNGSYNATTYPAFFAALNFQNTYGLSNATSKWYLPSHGQWYYFCYNLGGSNSMSLSSWNEDSNDAAGAPQGSWYYPGKAATISAALNSRMSNAGSSYYTAIPVWNETSKPSRGYWGSSEATASNGVVVGFGSNNSMHIFVTNGAKTSADCVRAAFAF